MSIIVYKIFQENFLSLLNSKISFGENGPNCLAKIEWISMHGNSNGRAGKARSEDPDLKLPMNQMSFLNQKLGLYHKDTEPLYHSFVYSLVPHFS